MAPRRKRQRLSEDGTEAVTAIADADPPSNAVQSAPSDDTVHKKNIQQRRSLFVRSLAPAVTTEDLTELFSESYPIKHAVAVLDPSTKQCKGFGFVTFADTEDAQRAKEELNGSELKGRKIRIEIAEPRHRDLDTEIPGPKKSVPSAAAVEAKAAREKLRKEESQPPRLIVRNLPWSIRTTDDLSALFRSYGKVKFVNLPKGHTGLLRGFGIVVMRGKKNAERALEAVNGKEVDGRTLAVDWAVEKETWENLQKTSQEEDTEMRDVREYEEDNNLVSDESSAVASDSAEESSELDSDSDADDSNTDYEDVSDSEDGGVEIVTENAQAKPNLNTLFIRNLPFTADDDSLKEHFTQFGPLRYARVVLDHDTERPKGTGFVSFVNEGDATNCLKGVPRTKLQTKTSDKKDGTTITVTHSVLENEDADPTGKYTMDGRVLHLSRAVERSEAARLTAEGAASRFDRDKDKRRLYLLSEGTISKDSPLYQHLSPSEVTMRESSAKQRKQLIQSNPSLHLSLTRLSVRNIPRSITSKDLKALARKAIVGFAEDVKSGKRQRLSKEEIARGGEAMVLAEKIRKKRGKGIVKQAKVVFETNEGSKVAEGTGAGRSRGYGFIEYYTHRNALMGLRWLNGHAVDYRVKGELPKGKKAAKEAMEDRKKRLIVEFAIENANVVNRRTDRENKARDPKPQRDDNVKRGAATTDGTKPGKKRKRDSGTADEATLSAAPKGTRGMGRAGKDRKGGKGGNGTGVQGTGAEEDGHADAKTGIKDGRLAQRSRIIRKKRMARRAKKAGKAA